VSGDFNWEKLWGPICWDARRGRLADGSDNLRAVGLRSEILGVVAMLEEKYSSPTLFRSERDPKTVDEAIQRLCAAGIEPDMHVGQPPEFFQASALRIAEYTGGMLVKFVGPDFLTEEQVNRLITEHQESTESEGGNRLVEVDARLIPKRAWDYQKLRVALNMSEHWLAADLEPLGM
jgi:hypothetical protein